MRGLQWVGNYVMTTGSNTSFVSVKDKDIDQVMANQSDLVDVVHTLKQVVCVKG